MIKRKVIPLLGIFILIFPIWMVPVKQYIQNQRVSATKEEQIIEEPSLLEPNNETLSDDIQGPFYYFQEQQMNAKINESFIIQIASDIQTDEVTISLPVEAQIEGNVIQDNKEDQWIIKRELDGNMFKLPVSFSQVGEYIVSIISDNGPTKNLVITIEEEFIPTEEYVEHKEEKGVESEAQLDSLIELEDDREPIEAEETSEINMTVTKDNFLQHFDLHGTARYDTESGLLVLTEALNNQSGNATLK